MIAILQTEPQHLGWVAKMSAVKRIATKVLKTAGIIKPAAPAPTPTPVATVSKPQAAGIRPKAPILSAFADASAATRNFQERQERFGLG